MGYFEIWRFKIRPMVFPSIETAATASQPSGPSAFSCSWIFSNLVTPPMLIRSTLYSHFIYAPVSTFRTAYKKSLACRSCFLLSCIFCHSASRRCVSSFETVNVLRTALSKRSASVLPGTSGRGRVFKLPQV